MRNGMAVIGLLAMWRRNVWVLAANWVWRTRFIEFQNVARSVRRALREHLLLGGRTIARLDGFFPSCICGGRDELL